MRAKADDNRIRILKEMGISEAELSFTQSILVTQYDDCWKEYGRTKDGKIRREIMTAMRHLRKELGLNKGPSKKKKSIKDYIEKHNGTDKTASA